MTLQLDHKDGNPRNNQLSNLRFLCGNCHFLTETHGGKNKWKQSKIPTREEIDESLNRRLAIEASTAIAIFQEGKLGRNMITKALSDGRTIESIARANRTSHLTVMKAIEFHKIAFIPQHPKASTAKLTREKLNDFFAQGFSYEAVGRLCGCTGAAIKKRAKKVEANATLHSMRLPKRSAIRAILSA